MAEKTKPIVSVIIPSWFTPNQHGRWGINETFYISAECLYRFLAVTPRDKFELIIIDNGSTLSDADILLDETDNPGKYKYTVTKYFTQADKLISNPTNLGFGPAINQGIGVASGEYIIQVNNDILVWEGWMDALLEVFTHTELQPPVGVVMPNLIKSNFQKDCLRPDGKIDFLKMLTLDVKNIVLPHPDVYELGAEFGSLWIIKKELVDKLIEQDGFFFDPQFLIGMSEDRDVWIRIRKLGYQTYRTNKTRVGHLGNLTISKIPDHKKYTTENREKLKKKWNL